MQGAKAVRETLASDYRIITLCATEGFLLETKTTGKVQEVIETSEKELTTLGSVDSNSAALAVVQMKVNGRPHVARDAFALVLDDIRDPGNLGSIIRSADWFGITTIVASEETADFYNPKVINATMGSFLRVSMHYLTLDSFLKSAQVPVFGTFLDGEDVHTLDFGIGGMVVIGNESRGISPVVEKSVTRRITIPRRGHAESLNAGVATAVVLDNLRRRS